LAKIIKLVLKLNQHSEYKFHVLNPSLLIVNLFPRPLPPEREGGIKLLKDLSPSLLGEGFRER
jgi:hypothetical protein